MTYSIASLVLVGSFTAIATLIPRIGWIVQSRNLTEGAYKISSHKVSIPTVAGISFFLIIFSLIIIKYYETENK